MLVIFKLIEAGASRCEQYSIAFSRVFISQRHGTLQSSGALKRHRPTELRGNFFRRRADKQNEFGSFTQYRHQRGVVTAFILAAENDEESARKSLQGLYRCVDVGGFGIVEETHAGNFGYKLQPVLDAREAAHGGGHFRRSDTREKSGRSGGQSVFEIVLAAQADTGSIQQPSIFAFAPKDDLLAAQIGAADDTFRSAEPEDLRPRRRGFGGGGIVGIDYRSIVFGLILKNAPFGPRVVFKGGVPVEVIGSKVQQH